MKRAPIKFVLKGNSAVHTKARINMGLEYPIRYGSKVDYQGKVHGDFIPKLLEYRNEIRNRTTLKNSSEWGPLGPSSYSLKSTDNDGPTWRK